MIAAAAAASAADNASITTHAANVSRETARLMLERMRRTLTRRFGYTAP